MKYAIVNDIDRPDIRHVAQRIRGKYYYMSRAFDKAMKEYDGMQFADATAIEDFGFSVREHKNNTVTFILCNPATAKYRDGGLRVWQDEKKVFTLPMVILKLRDIRKL